MQISLLKRYSKNSGTAPYQLCTASQDSLSSKSSCESGQAREQGASILSAINPYEVWAQQEHINNFSGWDQYSTSKLLRVCNQFNECQLAQGLAQRTDLRTIWDVGCATGRFYQFFRKNFPDAKYRGFDISETAIGYARQRYTDGEFNIFDGELGRVSPGKPDLIFCRDVVHRQSDPAGFLAKLYQAAGRYLVTRVRTREAGATVFEIEQTRQYGYGYCVQY